MFSAKFLGFPPLVCRVSFSSCGFSICSLQEGSQIAYRGVQGLQKYTSCQTILKLGHKTGLVLSVKVSQAQPRLRTSQGGKYQDTWANKIVNVTIQFSTTRQEGIGIIQARDDLGVDQGGSCGAS